MILEVHGDACRLGYLKVVACLLEDGSPRSPDYLASLLLEASKAAVNDVDKQLGILRTEVNAQNYVKLASHLGFYDKATGKLGEFGAAYVAINSSASVRRHVTGEELANLSTIVRLNEVEKLLFLQAVLTRDFHFIVDVMRWAVGVKQFTRQQAMNVLMEEFYAEALRRMLRRVSGRRRELILKELEQAATFRAERLKFPSKVEWIRSRLYAKYRHTVPPRLEWLADVGFLAKPRRGRYVVSDKFLKNWREMEVVLSKPVDRVGQAFFSYFVPAALALRIGGQQVEAQVLAESYKVLQRAYGRVKLDTLCLAAAYRMIDSGYRSTPASMSRAFSYLSLLYSDRVFATYSEEGGAEVTGLDVPLVE